MAQEFAGYLFAYFEGGGDKNLQEQLRFAVSEDAVNWYALNGNRPIIASDSISESGGIRDPHILRGEDGCYYLVATDMHTFDPKQGWGANPGIVMLKSGDLVNWTHSKVVLAKDYAKNNGFYNVTLHVWNCNPGAMRFYESLGLTPQYTNLELIVNKA